MKIGVLRKWHTLYFLDSCRVIKKNCVIKFWNCLPGWCKRITYLSPGKKHDLRNFWALKSSPKRARTFSTKTTSYTGPQIWNLIRERLRTLATLNNCKTEINKMQVKNRVSSKYFVTDCLQKRACDSDSPPNPF